MDAALEPDDLADYKVTSEVHVFSDNEPLDESATEKIVISMFQFTLPDGLQVREVGHLDQELLSADSDGDLVVRRKNHIQDHRLCIKHHVNTSLNLVGLQVWRGALLLADYLLHTAANLKNGPNSPCYESVIELGAGTGLTSIVAAMVSSKVTSTDINLGNILSLIKENSDSNSAMARNRISVMELDFYKEDYPPELLTTIENTDLIIAADVVYHDELTDAFLRTLCKLMSIGREKTALIALEKRYVFTLAELDSVAPCFDYFSENLHSVMSRYQIKQLDTDQIPQYFCYEKVKELVLFQISQNCYVKV
nr:EOG090X0C5G [Leptodora kindtii]